ncbi:alpha/beta hydrolase [Bacterioplanes sanyensis]|uniref:Alpha/beta hydrolase n=1 Tax=Bacterioplanes sanyensis TaxID=1249553 RepID=A0A222FNF1_9GAMM|nr:alpha/beta hydrolase [Bacterioplanes sanyensis]ASP39891.1 alpha/beta hydrolase [Bacterioplanes sanyensis]
MKSSSTLFPVSLMRAEQHQDLAEDVYLVKHNRDPDRSVQLALTHLSYADGRHRGGQPVVLLHGSFTNRRFWWSDRGIGLARYLVEQGHDVWLLDQRGHGLSPRNLDYRNNTLQRYVSFDIGAINEFISERTAKKPIWIGHSLGGVVLSSALACGVLNRSSVRSCVLLGTQAIRRPRYLWLPLLGWGLRRWIKRRGEVSGQRLKIGPETEPAGLVNEYLKRHDWFGSWQFRSPKRKLMPGWQACDVPLLSMAGAADTSDPEAYCQRFAALYGGPLQYVRLGKAEGFQCDYGHVDMVVSRQAAEEVWPLISDWCHGRSLGERFGQSA